MAAVLVWSPNQGISQNLTPIPQIFSGPGPWIDVRVYNAKGDGTTDDSGAVQAAINACKTPTLNGCTIYFPNSGAGTAASYFIGSGLNIPTTAQGIKLVGECATGFSSAVDSSPTCSHLVASGNLVMLTVGDTTGTKYRGLVVQDLGFSDSSGANVQGAIHLQNVEDFNLTNVHCDNIKNTAGYCFQFDGTTASGGETQFGVVVNPSVANTKFPVQTNHLVSEVNFYGGSLTCTLGSGAPTAGSIGMDFGKTNDPGGVNAAGEFGIYGTHILNCETAMSIYNMGAIQWYGMAEQAVTSGAGTGASVDGTSSTFTVGNQFYGSFNNFTTGIFVNARSSPQFIPGRTLIASDITAVPSGGTALNIAPLALPFTFITGPGVDNQNTTSLQFAGQSTQPTVSASSSGKIYYDKSANVFEASLNGGSYGFLGFASSALTASQLVTGNGNGNLLTLAAGTNGQCVASNGTAPSYAACGTIGTDDELNKSSSITNQTLVNSTPAAGDYMVNVIVEITATETSTVTVAASGTCMGNGVTRSHSGSAVNFSATANNSVIAFPCYADNGSTISYSATVGGGTLGTGRFAAHAWAVRQ